LEELMVRIADLKDAELVRCAAKVQRAVDGDESKPGGGGETIRQHAQRRRQHG